MPPLPRAQLSGSGGGFAAGETLLYLGRGVKRCLGMPMVNYSGSHLSSLWPPEMPLGLFVFFFL